jgi:uncharacterized membrane protein
MGEEHLPGAGLLQQIALWLGLVAELIAVVIIGIAIVVALWSTVRDVIRPGGQHPWHDTRLGLGRSLMLALEFLLAADIVRTAVAPTWDEIGKLAAVATIRTALNFFLQREIQLEQEHDESDAHIRSTRGEAPGGRRSV